MLISIVILKKSAKIMAKLIPAQSVSAYALAANGTETVREGVLFSRSRYIRHRKFLSMQPGPDRKALGSSVCARIARRLGLESRQKLRSFRVFIFSRER